MARIQHGDSIVSDSIISPSSPSHAIHEDTKDNDTITPVDSECGPQVRPKRVVRTYGRPKRKEDIEDVVDNDLGIRARILRTAPRDADDQLIPESDDTIENIPEFRFPWRDKLKAIDEELGIPGNQMTTHQHEATPSIIAEDRDASDSRKELSGIDETTVASSALMQPESLFDGSLSSLLSEPTSNSPQSLENDGPVLILPKKSSTFHKRVIETPGRSDSEDISPQHPYAINSPKQRSSSTPPTSPLGKLALQESVVQSRSSTKATEKLNSTNGKGKERKTKGLTKKEVIEMQKESARLLAGRHISIERTRARSTHTIASLFNKLKPLPTSSRPDSDPIAPFSSPGIMLRRSHSSSDRASPPKSTRSIPVAGSSEAKLAMRHSQENSRNQELGEQIRDEETEEDMPGAEALLREHTEKQLRKELEEKDHARENTRATGLEALKRKALEAVQHTRAGGKIQGHSDTDDDLEVEVMVSSSREDKTKNSEVYSAAQTAIKISGDEIEITPRPTRVSHKDLREAAKPAFLSRKGPSRQRGQQVSVSQQDLNDLLLQRADRQGGAIEEKKKEQWLKTGGVLKEHRRPEIEEKLVKDWLEKGAARENGMEVVEGEEEEEEEEEEEDGDPEYDPGDVVGHESEESDIEASQPGPPDYKTAFHQHMGTSDEDVDADKENHRPALRRQAARAIVSSDDDDEPMDLSRSRRHTVLVPDTSFGDHSDDSSGGDKENSAQLAFSFDENKENEGVPRHPERGRVIDVDKIHTSEFLSGLSSPVSRVVGNSTMSREPLSRLDAEAELAFVPEAVTQRRDGSLDRVLQVLHEEDKDATLAPIDSTSKGVEHRRSSTPSESEHLDGPTLVSPVGFSPLFSADRSEGPAPGSVLGASGFSQLFSHSGDNEDTFATPLKVKPQHRLAQAKRDNFEFTQPNALLPSIKISESQRREVDAMFDKDQEFKLDEAKRSKRQFRYAASSTSDTLHFGSFVPSPMALTPRSIRRPLETLSLEGGSDDALVEEIPQTQPTRRSRLLRGPRERSSSSPSPPLVPRNAFDVLRDGASKGRQVEHGAKQDIGKSAYIEVEAEESDEEAMLGFGGAKENDDEEGGNEDPNMVVENLVDDSLLDDAAQAADLVLQKHLEHQAIDDAALEKLHQDAVDGKLRGKRRDRGIGFEDSDSDSGDDVSSSRRQPSSKKRRVDGDALEACGNDPATAPFYDAYRVGLTDEFLDISQEESTSTQEKVGQDSSDGERPGMVDPIRIRRQIMDEKSKQGLRSSSPEMDPENASWVDSDDQDMADMDDVRVENGPLHPHKVTTSTRSRLDHVGYRGGFEGKKTGASEERQLKTWASQEAQANTFATGRGGFSRKDSVNTSSSRKQGKLAPMKDSTRNEGNVIVKHSALISHVEKRKGFNG